MFTIRIFGNFPSFLHACANVVVGTFKTSLNRLLFFWAKEKLVIKLCCVM